jgi:SagB-type dehydrogenase family enzyme
MKGNILFKILSGRANKIERLIECDTSGTTYYFHLPDADAFRIMQEMLNKNIPFDQLSSSSLLPFSLQLIRKSLRRMSELSLLQISILNNENIEVMIEGSFSYEKIENFLIHEGPKLPFQYEYSNRNLTYKEGDYYIIENLIANLQIRFKNKDLFLEIHHFLHCPQEAPNNDHNIRAFLLLFMFNHSFISQYGVNDQELDLHEQFFLNHSSILPSSTGQAHTVEDSSGEIIYLNDFENDAVLEKSFWEVALGRKSYDPTKKYSILTKDEISSLLKLLFKTKDHPAQSVLYARAGGIDEIIPYLVVDQCTDLKRGIYKYIASTHTLDLVSDDENEVEEVMRQHSRLHRCQRDQAPHAALIFSSEIKKLKPKYKSLSLKLSLLNTGVILHHLHLCCELLGLQARAVGISHHSYRFSKKLNINYLPLLEVGIKGSET